MTRVRITEPLVCVLSRSVVQAGAACAGVVAAVAMLLPLNPEASALPGRIEGIVRLVASGEGPIVSGAYPTRRVNRPVQHSAEISNVIVFIKDAPRLQNLSLVRARMVQADETFTPARRRDYPRLDGRVPERRSVLPQRVLAVAAATFDLGRYPSGAESVRAFSRPGIIKVFCQLHSHMSASIRVFDHPWFTMPAGDGSFTIDNVPAGDTRWRHGTSASASVAKTVYESRRARRRRSTFTLPVERHDALIARRRASWCARPWRPSSRWRSCWPRCSSASRCACASRSAQAVADKLEVGAAACSRRRERGGSRNCARRLRRWRRIRR